MSLRMGHAVGTLLTIGTLGAVPHLVLDAVSQAPRAPSSHRLPADTLAYVIEGLPDHITLGAPLEFVVRVENETRASISVPSNIGPGGGYVEINLVDPNGERILFMDELISEFHGQARDAVRLKPGTFYGQRTSFGRMPKKGLYHLTLILHGPTAPHVPDMVRGALKSATRAFTVD